MLGSRFPLRSSSLRGAATVMSFSTSPFILGPLATHIEPPASAILLFIMWIADASRWSPAGILQLALGLAGTLRPRALRLLQQHTQTCCT